VRRPQSRRQVAPGKHPHPPARFGERGDHAPPEEPGRAGDRGQAASQAVASS
jgi:hypothetical protein